jgi:hypothetical protein
MMVGEWRAFHYNNIFFRDAKVRLRLFMGLGLYMMLIWGHGYYRLQVPKKDVKPFKNIANG